MPVFSKENGLGKDALKGDRLKFGIGSLMYHGEEGAFGPIHTVVIRALGGTDIHLGLMGAVLTSAAALLGWVAAPFLRISSSNRKAMCWALFLGAFFALLLVALLFLAAWKVEWTSWLIYFYIILVFCMAGASGIQQSVESNWIGDLVPRCLRGWFVSGKAIVNTIGLMILIIFFGQVAARKPHLAAYGGLYAVIFFSHLVAVLFMRKVDDRIPQTKKFFSTEEQERMDYRDRGMWGYIWYLCWWTSGRVAMLAFTTAYLLDHLNWKIDRAVLLSGGSLVVSIFMLRLMGRISDRWGSRRPLIFISLFAGLSMSLYVFSAWWGVWPVLFFAVLNGAAGATHTMLTLNFSLEIFPEKGRANCIVFSRLILGFWYMFVATVAGMIMQHLRGWSIMLWGAEFNYYHVFFLGCSLLTAGCVLPLLLVWRKGTSSAILIGDK